MTNRAAAALHRRLDDAAAEAAARDGGEPAGRQGALIPPRLRRIDMQSMNRAPQPTVTLAELWERTSARGSRYFSGYLGGCQVLMFDGGEKPHPTREGETVHVWRLVLQDRAPARRPQNKPPEAVAQRSPAQHQGDGWRGSAYRRPANGAQRAPADDGGAFVEDGVDDLYR